MLRLIIYDISCPKRLRSIARVCEDYGLRVQKSVFECWLENERFDRLWQELLDQMHLQEDSICAYSLDASAASARRGAGNLTNLTEKRSQLIV
ncbi:MAG: CRISPR-associated endonuclease Cas2 [Akkermansiaceae bacterium]|nr:CRISPR-associated endonuclease Cas2 [Akkermansiaceae bacterium]